MSRHKKLHSSKSYVKKPYAKKPYAKKERTFWDKNYQPHKEKKWNDLSKKFISREEVKMLVEQSAQKAFNKYRTPRKQPEVYTIHSSDSESKLGK